MRLPIFQKYITDDSGNVLAGATIDVFNAENGARASLYSNRGGTSAIGNPTTSDSEGLARFYVATGEYRVVATSGGNSAEFNYTAVWGPESEKIFENSFASVADMEANARSLINDVGQVISTGAGRWKTTTTVKPIVIANTSPQLYAFPLNGVWMEDFGVAEGGDFSTEFRKAVSIGTVRLPAKRYVYDGGVITDNEVRVRGERVPTVNAGYTSLENGSIIEGTFSTTAKVVDIRDFGIDLGTDTAAPDGDGIKCTAPLNAGVHIHAENVIALLKNKTSAFHATLFESYKKFTGGNISGNHGFFGCVIKCQNVNLSSVYTSRNDSDGLFLKSDTTFGRCKNVNIGKVIVDGDATQDFGVRVQADSDELSKVNIGEVIVDGCATSILAQTLTGVITELNIDKAILDNPTVRGVYSQAGAGTINGFNINELFVINALDTGVEYSGSQKSASIGYASIVYATGTTQTEWDKGVVVGSTVSGTSFDNININQLYSSVNLGAIKYNNSTFTDGNKLGQYTALIKGSGKPVMGFSAPTDTGAAVKITPVYNTREKSSIVKAAPTANTTVTSIEFVAAGGTEVYDAGYMLTVINDSAFTYTINNSVGGKIINKGGANVSIPTNEAVRYVFGGAVWHEI